VVIDLRPFAAQLRQAEATAPRTSPIGRALLDLKRISG
jgi:hypothetical protein